jgi:hypothetical protein
MEAICFSETSVDLLCLLWEYHCHLLGFDLSVESNPVYFFLFFVTGVCSQPDVVMPLRARTGEQVGGVGLHAPSAVLLIFGPKGF